MRSVPDPLVKLREAARGVLPEVMSEEIGDMIGVEPDEAMRRLRAKADRWADLRAALDSLGGPAELEEGSREDEPFSEGELELHFRAYKAARRIATATAGGDRERAADELTALLELVEPSRVTVR